MGSSQSVSSEPLDTVAKAVGHCCILLAAFAAIATIWAVGPLALLWAISTITHTPLVITLKTWGAGVVVLWASGRLGIPFVNPSSRRKRKPTNHNPGRPQPSPFGTR